jgi:transcriptional regulatory protein GAL4
VSPTSGHEGESTGLFIFFFSFFLRVADEAVYRHLTEVEERLERAEALLRQMKQLLPSHVRRGDRTSSNSRVAPPQRQTRIEQEGRFDFTNLEQEMTVTGPPEVVASAISKGSLREGSREHQAADPLDFADDPTLLEQPSIVFPPPTEATSARGGIAVTQIPPRSSHDHHPPEPGDTADLLAPRSQHGNPLESPPTTEDFDWDEQETVGHPSPTANDSLNIDEEGDGVAQPPILDGMASLTVGDKEAGYLGVASGAALLRVLEPARRRRDSQNSQNHARPLSRYISGQSTGSIVGGMTGGGATSFASQLILNPNRHIADAMIDAYFRTYHLSYPILHEPSFRAQWTEVIPRPSGESWVVLAYVVAAIGVFATATSGHERLDLTLFARAREVLSFKFLEMGNLTLVQALALISNYQQKRDKPNSGYNYLGLAVRMAMGLGLHKEFQGWSISPLNMEIRRRVWWALCVFDVGATITFSRPLVWPFEGVEVRLPMNVHDRDLTAGSRAYPTREAEDITPYTAVRAQASFHVATAPIYARVIGKPFPSADELARLEKEHFETWENSVPACFAENASQVPTKYAFAHNVMQWRSRNLRIIMYRPTVIRRALHAREGRQKASDMTPSAKHALERCLADAKATIEGISSFWRSNEHTRLGAWYAL